MLVIAVTCHETGSCSFQILSNSPNAWIREEEWVCGMCGSLAPLSSMAPRIINEPSPSSTDVTPSKACIGTSRNTGTIVVDGVHSKDRGLETHETYQNIQNSYTPWCYGGVTKDIAFTAAVSAFPLVVSIAFFSQFTFFHYHISQCTFFYYHKIRPSHTTSI